MANVTMIVCASVARRGMVNAVRHSTFFQLRTPLATEEQMMVKTRRPGEDLCFPVLMACITCGLPK
jgi:hypothetical protein